MLAVQHQTIGKIMACAGGFSSFLLGMDWNSYLQSSDGSELAGDNPPFGRPPAILPENVIQPSLGRFIGFMFVIAFAGILILAPLRKVSMCLLMPVLICVWTLSRTAQKFNRGSLSSHLQCICICQPTTCYRSAACRSLQCGAAGLYQYVCLLTFCKLVYWPEATDRSQRTA